MEILVSQLIDAREFKFELCFLIVINVALNDRYRAAIESVIAEFNFPGPGEAILFPDKNKPFYVLILKGCIDCFSKLRADVVKINAITHFEVEYPVTQTLAPANCCHRTKQETIIALATAEDIHAFAGEDKIISRSALNVLDIVNIIVANLIAARGAGAEINYGIGRGG